VPPSDRGEAAQGITAFCDRYPSTQVVVTSRPGPALTAFTAKGFQLYEIAPLTDEDVAAYIERWLDLTRGTGVLGHMVEVFSSLLARSDWIRTPLLITQLLTMYFETADVPDSEIQLYDMMYSAIFEARDTLRGINRLLPPKGLGRLVSYLTYELKARAGGQGVADSEFRLLLQAYGQLDELHLEDIEGTLVALDVPVRRTPARTAGGESRWSITRDRFSEYLAARWVLYSSTFSDITNRLMTMIGAGGCVAGGQFTLQLAARLDHDAQQRIIAYLRAANDDSPQLPETTRAAIIQILLS
jgi:hypothetical protein